MYLMASLEKDHCSEKVSSSCCPPIDETISSLLTHGNATNKCNVSLNFEVKDIKIGRFQ